MKFRSLHRSGAAALAAALVVGCGSSQPTELASAAVSASGLRAGYALAEGSGTTTADASGNGITGTLSGTSWTAGHSGSGLAFNGVASSVGLGNPAALAFTGSFTLEAWVKEGADVADDGIIVSRSSSTAGWELKSSPDTGARTFAVAVYTPAGAYAGRYSRTVRSLGTWYHVAGVYDAAAAALHIYVNGVLDDGVLLGTVPTSVALANVGVTLGRRAMGLLIAGTLDDVRLYGRALSAAEIQADLANPVDGTAAPFDFSVAAPASGSVAASGTFGGTVGAGLVSGAAQAVTFGVSGLPSGAAGSFAPASCTPPCTSTLTLTTTPSTPAGSSTVTVSGTSGTLVHTSSFTLAVTSGGADGTSPTGTVAIDGGASATSSTSVTLTLSATDALSGVSMMRFSNVAGSWSTPRPYATTASWSLATGAGTKTVYASFQDGAGNWSAAVTDTIVLDTTAPAISAVSAAGITGSSATIRWTTSEPATSQVLYGTTTQLGSTTALDPTLVLTHAVTLTGLAPSRTYYFRARSADAAGNVATSSRSSFRTTSSVDTTPPTAPSNLAVTGTTATGVSLSWTGSTDDVGVTGYRVYRNSAQVATSGSTTYTDGGLTPGGTYAYAVAAQDAAGNVSPLSNTVTATTLGDTAPPTAPAGLTATAGSSSRIDLTWTASTDNVGVTGYDVFRDGTQVTTVTATACSDGGLAASSTHSYVVRARDAAGNVSGSSNTATATTLAASGATFPLAFHASGRYLVDASGNPWRLQADAAWLMSIKATQSQVDTYLADRKAKGFNAFYLMAMVHPGGYSFAPTAPNNVNGDGPFTTPGNFATQNERYWSNVDTMVDKAAAQGIAVLFAFTYLGYAGGNQGWANEVSQMSAAQATAWGTWLGNRYKGRPNVVWFGAGDYTPPAGSTLEANVVAIFRAIKAAGATQIWCAELNQPDSIAGIDDPVLAAAADGSGLAMMDSFYGYGPGSNGNAYQTADRAWRASTPRPTWQQEGIYEFDPYVGAFTGATWETRRARLWTVLAGAVAGDGFGSRDVWKWINFPQLSTPGSIESGYAFTLFASLPWWRFRPSGVAAGYAGKNLVTAGAGSFGSSTYVTSALTDDGRYLLAYYPGTSGGTATYTFTVDLTALAGTTRTRWWNPVTGGFTAIGTYPNTGAVTFTTPGRNGDGDDWLLVLDPG